jgi:hypothetical protein
MCRVPCCQLQYLEPGHVGEEPGLQDVPLNHHCLLDVIFVIGFDQFVLASESYTASGTGQITSVFFLAKGRRSIIY